MLIAVDEKLLANITNALLASTKALNEFAEREKAAWKAVDSNRLLTEQQAQEYLSRDAETLRYYRALGLDSYKKGKDRWYSKADINNWLVSKKVTRHKR